MKAVLLALKAHLGLTIVTGVAATPAVTGVTVGVVHASQSAPIQSGSSAHVAEPTTSAGRHSAPSAPVSSPASETVAAPATTSAAETTALAPQATASVSQPAATQAHRNVPAPAPNPAPAPAPAPTPHAGPGHQVFTGNPSQDQLNQDYHSNLPPGAVTVGSQP